MAIQTNISTSRKYLNRTGHKFRDVENIIREGENGRDVQVAMPIRLLMKLGSQLKTYCKDRGWTLTKLSKQSGVPIATLHGWANGRSRLDLKQLKKVAEALEVSMHSLAFGTPDPFETGGEEILRELFTGDLRVSIQKIERKK